MTMNAYFNAMAFALLAAIAGWEAFEFTWIIRYGEVIMYEYGSIKYVELAVCILLVAFGVERYLRQIRRARAKRISGEAPVPVDKSISPVKAALPDAVISFKVTRKNEHKSQGGVMPI